MNRKYATELSSGFLAILVALAILGSAWAEDVQAQATDYTKISPAALVKNRPKGKLTNPYKDTDIDVVAQGEELYQRYSCGGCHGGGGGGGMAPPLTNDIWIYGGDDDTLFRLVVLGSVGLQQQGYSRKSGENVVGPMDPFDKLISSSDDLWRIIVFVRSKYQGDPAHKFGAPAETK